MTFADAMAEAREAREIADAAMAFGEAHDSESLVCGDCRTTWTRIAPLRGLADLDCPGCPAIYSSVGVNREP